MFLRLRQLRIRPPSHPRCTRPPAPCRLRNMLRKFAPLKVKPRRMVMVGARHFAHASVPHAKCVRPLFQPATLPDRDLDTTRGLITCCMPAKSWTPGVLPCTVGFIHSVLLADTTTVSECMEHSDYASYTCTGKLTCSSVHSIWHANENMVFLMFIIHAVSAP